ncbi:MAG TPA: antibiotic biosynthesis monooxygenase [Acidobacteriaceae bacterium]|nr:antibiotic biosynthesis monooxygenase [Acidobacteriaceae bacterium]
MILEAANLQVVTGQEHAFEEAMVRAAPVIAATPGYIRHELRRCMETKGRYLLLVQWETLEAHTVAFRESPRFGEWRAIIGPFFAAPPNVEHYTSVLNWPAAGE